MTVFFRIAVSTPRLFLRNAGRNAQEMGRVVRKAAADPGRPEDHAVALVPRRLAHAERHIDCLRRAPSSSHAPGGGFML